MMLENLARLFASPTERKRVDEVSAARESMYKKVAGEFVGLLCEVAENLDLPYYRGISKNIDVGRAWVDKFIQKYTPEYKDKNYMVYHTLRILDAEAIKRKIQEKQESGFLSRRDFEVLKGYAIEADNVLDTELKIVYNVQSGRNEDVDDLYNKFFGHNQETGRLIVEAMRLREAVFSSGNCLVDDSMSVDCWCGNLITPMEKAIQSRYLSFSSRSST